MRKIFLALILCLFSLATIAQQQRCTIKGKLVDSQTKDALMFANCVLHYATDTIGIFKGEAANQDGEFSFKNIKPRKLIFKASFIGYETYRKEIEVSDFKNGIIDLGTISMKSACELEGQVVIAQKKRIEIDDDKISMNVDDGMAAASENAFDLLKRVPGVFIDNDDNITLNGQSGVAFWYNGREMKMEWESVVDFLKGISPEQVDKFEVLTNPGVRYDASGTGGIINLKLKNSHNYGINGNIGANLSHRTDWGEGLNGRLNYVDDKWIASFGYSFNHRSDVRSDSTHRYTWRNGDTTLFRNNSENRHQNNRHNFDFSASYSIDTTSTLGFSSNLSISGSPWTINESPTYISSYPNYFLADSVYNSANNSKRSRNNFMAGVSYVKKLDNNDTKISSDLDFNHGWSDNESKSGTQYFSYWDASSNYTGSPDLYRFQSYYRTTENSSDNVSWRVDYYKPLGRGKKFEAGFKTNLSISDKDYVSSEAYESNRFKYTENINSLYASYTGKLTQKLDARIGLRFEQTNTKGDLITEDTTTIRHYFDIFPNIRLNYKFAMDNQLSLTYSYRIWRPWSDSQNPFVSKESDYSYRTGNPYLEPQYSHSIGLSHSWKYMLFTNLTWSYTQNNIDWLSESLDNFNYDFSYNPLALISHPVNFGTSQDVNLSVSFNKEFFEWWQVNANVGGRWEQILSSANLSEEVNKDNWSYNFRINSDFNLPGKTRLGFFYMFTSSSLMGTNKTNGWQRLDAHLSKSFFAEKLNLSLSAGWDLGRTNYSEGIYGNTLSKRWGNDHQIDFRFSLRYKFGKMYKNKQVQKIKTENFDERAGGESSGE